MKILLTVPFLLFGYCTEIDHPVITDYSSSKTLNDTSLITKARKNDYEHSVVLYRDSVLASYNLEKRFLCYDSLDAFLVLHKTEFSKQRLNIIVTQRASYKRVIDVLNLMPKLKIKGNDYRLLTASD